MYNELCGIRKVRCRVPGTTISSLWNVQERGHILFFSFFIVTKAKRQSDLLLYMRLIRIGGRMILESESLISIYIYTVEETPNSLLIDSASFHVPWNLTLGLFKLLVLKSTTAKMKPLFGPKFVRLYKAFVVCGILIFGRLSRPSAGVSVAIYK